MFVLGLRWVGWVGVLIQTSEGGIGEFGRLWVWGGWLSSVGYIHLGVDCFNLCEYVSISLIYRFAIVDGFGVWGEWVSLCAYGIYGLGWRPCGCVWGYTNTHVIFGVKFGGVGVCAYSHNTHYQWIWIHCSQFHTTSSDRLAAVL